MKFTGTLIEDLTAAVERAEQKAQADPVFAVESLLSKAFVAEPLLADSWFASVQEDINFDSKFLGVA